jgi:hypothetical protein
MVKRYPGDGRFAVVRLRCRIPPGCAIPPGTSRPDYPIGSFDIASRLLQRMAGRRLSLGQSKKRPPPTPAFGSSTSLKIRDPQLEIALFLVLLAACGGWVALSASGHAPANGVGQPSADFQTDCGMQESDECHSEPRAKNLVATYNEQILRRSLS